MGLSSLFGKKANQGVEGLPASGPRSAQDATRSGNSSGGPQNSTADFFGSARKTARATAQKIDEIEQEMTREAPKNQGGKGKPGHGNTARGKTGHGKAGPGQPPQVDSTYLGSVIAPTRSRRRSATDSTTPFFSHSTDVLLDDSTLSNAIELSDSISNPAIEEAAILYAYGDLPPAIEVLKKSIQPEQSNVRNPQAWLMLLELYEVIGNTQEFDGLAEAFAEQFDLAPSPQEDDSPEPAAAGPIAGNMSFRGTDPSGHRAGEQHDTASDRIASAHADQSAVEAVDLSDLAGVVFDGPLNAGIIERLEHLKRLASVHRVLYVDFSKVTAIETQGAELVLRMLAAFAKSNRTLVVRGADHLLGKLVAAVEARRNHVASFIWQLMFDLFRLTGRQTEFDNKSIDYLAVFEGSLPVWEPYPGHVKIDPTGTVAQAPAPTPENPPAPRPPPVPTSIALKGVLVGKAERQLAELTEFASATNRVCIDCSALSRIDFTAAGALLNWAVSLQKHNKTAEFRQVSHLVSALLIVMGIHEVALIERR